MLYCILRGQIKGFNSSITAIMCQVGSYRTVVGNYRTILYGGKLWLGENLANSLHEHIGGRKFGELWNSPSENISENIFHKT